MPRNVTTVTPENVRIEYELAGVFSRMGASILDLLIQSLAVLILLAMYLLTELTIKFSVTSWPTAVMIVLGFLIFWGYFVYFETVWNGQTPGKRTLRLRAVREGGVPIDFPCAAIRGLIRPIDLTLIGFISILITGKNQRLGDLAAGTIVVKERSEWEGHLAPKPIIATVTHPESAYVKNIELVTPEQFETAKRFLERRAELQPELQEQLAAKIARPLMQHLGIEDSGSIVYSNLLAAIHDRCVQERGMQ